MHNTTHDLDIGTEYRNEHGHFKVVGKKPDAFDPEKTQYKIRAIEAEHMKIGETQWLNDGDLGEIDVFDA